MATVGFLVQSNSSTAPIWIQISHKGQYKRKTGLTTEGSKWSDKTKLPSKSANGGKNTVTKLKKLQTYIQDKADEDYSEGKTIDGKWLGNQVDIYFKRKGDTEHSEVITDVIALKLKEDVDLGESRVKAYKAMSNIIKEFQELEGTVYKIKDIDTDFAFDFYDFMLNRKKKKVQFAYANKKLGDLKVLCNFAKTKGILVNPHYEEIKSKRPKNEHIIFLNQEELLQIKNTEFKTDKLKNVQHLLLLGCELGQRYSDYMTITEKSFSVRGGMDVIEVFQSKPKKWITIPIKESIAELTKNGLPTKLSLSNFNKYVKELCKEAEINTLVLQPTKFEGERPKWEAVSSHICRRSFCTVSDSEGILTHDEIKYISGHTSVASLLNYIGKNDLEVAKNIMSRYSAVNHQKENVELKAENKTLKSTIGTLQKEIKRLQGDSPLTVVS